jgi:hypothetical protein
MYVPLYTKAIIEQNCQNFNLILVETELSGKVGKHLIGSHGWGWQDAVVLGAVGQILTAPFHFEARDRATREMKLI